MTRIWAQRGVAVVVATLVVVLATSTATYLLWSESLWLRQVENLVARARADTIARAATHWAAAILAEDDASVDHLNETWARRLPAIPSEGATLTGAIADEQAKFNLNNLVRGTAPSPADVVVLQRLLGALDLPATLADAIVDWIDPDDSVTQSAGVEDLDYLAREPAYRAPHRPVADVGELARVKSMTPEALARLAPHVTALPDETPVNVNTASATVLLAIVPSLSAADAARIVEARGRTPFRGLEDFHRALPQPTAAQIDGPIDVKSRFFSAEATVQVGRVAAGYRALIERGERGRSVIIALTQILP
ncbi:MAG TPA: type II secretion system minor pseudopilin GspK [Burkholderiales bacterium]|nr:type II secretion system minor pseudopilin GspK [Burkholderiales bacterium]